jgi:hypothetical protein
MNLSKGVAFHGVANVLPVLERDDAGETDQRTDFQHPAHPVGIFAETMEDALDFSGKGFELRQRVVKRVALVDDAVQSGFAGDFNLLQKNVGLALLVVCVVANVAALRTGQMVIIQADLADGHNFGMFGVFAQGRAEVGRGLS